MLEKFHRWQEEWEKHRHKGELEKRSAEEQLISPCADASTASQDNQIMSREKKEFTSTRNYKYT